MSNQAPETSQQRAQQRYELTQPIPVYDQLSERSMGALVNITIEGMMLLANEPVETNRIYQLVLQLPEPIAGQAEIEVGVDCLWTRSDELARNHWAGFQIIDASQQAIKSIEVLIREYGALAG